MKSRKKKMEGVKSLQKKGRRWVLRDDCKGQPFSGINLTMAMISTRSACEGLGLRPPSKSYSQLVDEYHRGYK